MRWPRSSKMRPSSSASELVRERRLPRRCSSSLQERLTSNRNGARVKRAASGALLIGRIFDDRDNRMTPSTAKKGNIHYRYYVSSVLAQGRKSEAGAIARVSASEIEAVILEALRASYPD